MYDMKADPREMNNIFGKAEYAKKQKELMQLLEETQKQYKDNDALRQSAGVLPSFSNTGFSDAP